MEDKKINPDADGKDMFLSSMFLSSYDSVPYPMWSFPDTHPDNIGAVATLLGMQPVSPESCRVLELGCARGGNLLPMAAALPGSEFIGVDLSERQIHQASEIVTETGLTNIRFLLQDVAALDESLGKFDYIICHGLFSWVDRQTQDRILGACRDMLTPEGVAYISYNTFPGWRMNQVVRELMCFHGRKFAEPAQQLLQARAILDFVAEQRTQPGDEYGSFMRKRANRLRTENDAYVLHEYLEDRNEPLYFKDFIELSMAAGMQYVADARLADGTRYSIAPALLDRIERVSNNHLELEQYLDFLTNREFRRTLLCHKEVRLEREITVAAIRRLHFTANVQPQDPDADVASSEPRTFTGPENVSITTPSPVTKAALCELSDATPLSLSFTELTDRAAMRLGQPFDASSVNTLATDLFAAHVSRAVKLSCRHCGCAGSLPERPSTTAYTRYEARQRSHVVNLKHRRLEINDEQRRLIQLLDGSRDASDLLDEMQQQGCEITSHELDEHLQRLLRHGLIRDGSLSSEHSECQMASGQISL